MEFRRWKEWKYKNLTIFAIGIITAIVLSKLEAFHTFLLNLDGLSYLSAFVAGIMFVSVFTVASSAVILLVLAEELNPFALALIAGLGSTLGDLLILHFIKDNLTREIAPIYYLVGGNRINRMFKAIVDTKYFSWLVPIVGAIIIASPFPDEIGVTLLGLSKIKTHQFVLISFLLNTLGILLVISASSFIKP